MNTTENINNTTSSIINLLNTQDYGMDMNMDELNQVKNKKSRNNHIQYKKKNKSPSIASSRQNNLSKNKNLLQIVIENQKGITDKNIK